VACGRTRGPAGLKAFRRAYPSGESFVVASNVERPFERELLPGVRVRYAGIPEVAQVVSLGQARPR